MFVLSFYSFFSFFFFFFSSSFCFAFFFIICPLEFKSTMLLNEYDACSPSFSSRLIIWTTERAAATTTAAAASFSLSPSLFLSFLFLFAFQEYSDYIVLLLLFFSSAENLKCENIRNRRKRTKD